jgi:hypothetical protein
MAKRCETCGVVVSNMWRHKERNRCKRVKERRFNQRGMPKHQRPKPDPRGQRNGQMLSKRARK